MVEFFFQLIKVYVGRENALNTTISNENWAELLEMARKQALIGVLYHAITKLPKEQRPAKPILLQWFLLAEQIKKSNEVVNHNCVTLYSRFKIDGRSSSILKGQGVALNYPTPLLRMPGDIDIWISGKNRKDVLSYLKSVAQVGSVTYHHCDFSFFKETPVEVHFLPTWMNNIFVHRKLCMYFKTIRNKEFSNEVLLPNEQNKVSIATLEFNRIYLLIHIYKHLFFEGIGLRQLMDYYYIVSQQCSDEVKENTRKAIEELGLIRFCGAVMYVLEKVFGLDKNMLIVEPNQKEGAFLLSEILLAGNFGQFDSRIDRTKNSNISFFISRTKRTLRFLRYYPSEVLWTPVFKIWHFFWRKYHGWI